MNRIGPISTTRVLDNYRLVAIDYSLPRLSSFLLLAPDSCCLRVNQEMNLFGQDVGNISDNVTSKEID
jgi:hypothetical protein